MTLSELIESNRELTEGDNYLDVLAAKDLLKNGKFEEALQMLEDLQVSMEKSNEIVAERSLRTLMQYVILCIDFPEKMRNNDAIWLKKIYESRDQIAYYMVLMPKINREYLEKIWEDELKTALKFARTEEKVKTEKLTWEQVFEIEYGQIKLENHGKQ